MKQVDTNFWLGNISLSNGRPHVDTIIQVTFLLIEDCARFLVLTATVTALKELRFRFSSNDLQARCVAQLSILKSKFNQIVLSKLTLTVFNDG